jgi:tyrosyl-tRNA synthetase
MVGRDVMKEYGLEPQVILTTDLLFGTDAHLEGEQLVGEKMSKSLGNYIGVDDPPSGENGIYGKVMSICDPLMWHYFDVLSARSPSDLLPLKQGHPKAAKKALALEITARYHGEEAAQKAAAEFDLLHPASGSDRGWPEEIEQITLAPERPSIFLSKVLVEVGLAKSNSEARRLLRQGGVEVDGTRVAEEQAELKSGVTYLIKVGKRHFRQVILLSPIGS